MACTTCGYNGDDYHMDPIQCVDVLKEKLSAAEERIKELEGTIRHHRTIVNVPIDQREGADERQADMALWSLVEEER